MDRLVFSAYIRTCLGRKTFHRQLEGPSRAHVLLEGSLMYKTPVTRIFYEWLALMELAYNQLTREQFRQLEDKIKYEIAFHRRAK